MRPEIVSFMWNVRVRISGTMLSYICQNAQMEERQTDEDGAPVVELHTASPFSNSVKNARMFRNT